MLSPSTLASGRWRGDGLAVGHGIGWEMNQQAVTRESRFLISPDGTSVVSVEYNSAPR